MSSLPNSSGIKLDHQKFTNPKISRIIWRLHEFVRRSSKFHHLQCVLKTVKHHDVSVLIQSYATYKVFSTNMVCKVRVRTASDKVRRLLGLSCGWSDSLIVCEDIAKDVNEESSGVDSLEEVSTWMNLFALLSEEVETSSSKFAKQLGLLRQQIRFVQLGKDVGSVPDMDEALEDLARKLGGEKVEDTTRMLAECSKWLVEQVRRVLTIMDECSWKFSAAPVMYVSTSLEEDTSVIVENGKSEDCEKIPVTTVDAEVQTEVEAVTSNVLESSIGSLSPPRAHSTPLSSFEESNPSSKLQDQNISETNSFVREETRYQISIVRDLITETFEEEGVRDRIRSLLELLDDGTNTVKSSVVDIIVDNCPHLFK